MSFVHTLGKLFLFLLRLFEKGTFDHEFKKAFFAHMASITYKALAMVLFGGVFVGGILVIQFNLILEKYNAQTFLGGLATSGIIRDVGPLMIAFLIAGKVGAYTTAELGSMRVTNQLDAMLCLGTDPFKYLIAPRFFAILCSTVLLVILGLAVSVIASAAIAAVTCGINPFAYFHGIPKFNNMMTLGGGIFKSLIYGFIVAGVSCFRGFYATGGARGVGQAVNQTAIDINFFIVFANFVSSFMLTQIETFFKAWWT